VNDNTKIVLVLALLLALWIYFRGERSAANSNDKLAQPGGGVSPSFGTDHVADAALATSSAPLTAVPPAPPGPAPRSPDQIEDDIRNQLGNPSYQAAAAHPDVAASNAYYGQFIGKIT
jgi:hypothetical protein